VLDGEWLEMMIGYSEKGGGTDEVSNKTFQLVLNETGQIHTVINIP
jgi:hypothetical protein